MKIIRTDSIEKLPDSTATIGFFDGVHRGHLFLIDNLKQIAKQKQQKSMVITFSVHPRKILQPQSIFDLLNNFDEKMERLSATDIDYCVVLDFSKEMAQLSAYEFLKYIHNQFSVKTMLIGYDHRFGHNRSEGFNDYVRFGTELGMDIVKTDEFHVGKESHLSASHIRHLVQIGDMENANKLLGYSYCFDGFVVHGKQNGRKIGFPTANLAVDTDKLIPAHGVFAVDVRYKNKIYRGMMNIGFNPTFGDGLKRTVEVNIFDFDDQIYGEKLTVFMLNKLRDEMKFSTVEQLVEQMNKDKKEALEFL